MPPAKTGLDFLHTLVGGGNLTPAFMSAKIFTKGLAVARQAVCSRVGAKLVKEGWI
jgi:hypothetical protein